jgi:hypothetical protein
MSMRATALLACLIAASGCVRAQVHGETPALLASDAASQQALREALTSALGSEPLLAPDALTATSQLVIEPAEQKVDGQRIQGRETRKPEHFDLLRVDGACVLRRASTAERFVLKAASCHPL